MQDEPSAPNRLCSKGLKEMLIYEVSFSFIVILVLQKRLLYVGYMNVHLSKGLRKETQIAKRSKCYTLKTMKKKISLRKMHLHFHF